MEDYRKSNYAINKVSKGIVYRNADGSILEVTFEKIAQDEPNFTKEDFEKLKQLSDGLYHEEEKKSNLESHYVKTSVDKADLENNYAEQSFEDNWLNELRKADLTEKATEAMTTLLTETQRRRLAMHIFGGMTIREIAKKEKCYRNAVWKSISSVRAKIKKFLKNF